MTTDNKKKLFWIAGIALAVLYFAPRFIRFGPPLPAGRPNMAQTPAQPVTPQWGPVARPLPKPQGDAPTATTPLPFDNLLGTWQGFSPSASSFCTLKFELRRKTDAPDKYAGFPELACMPTAALASGGLRGRGIRPFPQMSPLSAILTGSASTGSIAFTVDKSIGTAADGCSLTSFSATPFGASEVSAEWQTGNCEKPQHGQMMLRRTGK
jgi:hypothetical protein